MRRILAEKHKVGTYEIDKISLLRFDNKRFVLNDGIHTLAYFHKGLKKQILTDDHKKEKFSQTKKIQKDSHKKKSFSQMEKIFIKRRDFHGQKGFKRSSYEKEEILSDEKDFKRFS